MNTKVKLVLQLGNAKDRYSLLGIFPIELTVWIICYIVQKFFLIFCWSCLTLLISFLAPAARPNDQLEWWQHQQQQVEQQQQHQQQQVEQQQQQQQEQEQLLRQAGEAVSLKIKRPETVKSFHC